MKKIFITGVSGTGKTTIAQILNTKGIRAISLDEVPDLCFWRNKVTGKKVDYKAELNKDFIDAHDWICDVETIKKLLNEENGTIVVLGSAANQEQFLPLFDKILLLQCKPETFIARIQQRPDNDFGKDKSAQDLILSQYQEFERDLLKKGAVVINVEGTIDAVVGNIIKEIEYMKTWTLRFRAVDKHNFDEVKSGLKPVETRAATIKYQPIEEGDTLIFVCGKERFSKQIAKKYHFPSIDAMIKEIPYQQIMPSVKSVAEMKKVYSSYSGYDQKIKEFGIFAFEL